MKVKTIYGMSDFQGIKRSEVNKILNIEFESGRKFRCTPEQIIYIEKDLPIWADCLSIGEEVEIEGRKEKIIKIEELIGTFYVYDLLHVNDR